MIVILSTRYLGSRLEHGRNRGGGGIYSKRGGTPIRTLFKMNRMIFYYVSKYLTRFVAANCVKILYTNLPKPPPPRNSFSPHTQLDQINCTKSPRKSQNVFSTNNHKSTTIILRTNFSIHDLL